VHLNLPARYDPHTTKPTPYFTDPRTTKGQVLWPKLYPERRLRKLEAQMTADGAAAQLQQTPTVGGGSILPRKFWRIWDQWDAPVCAFYMLSVDPSVKDGKANDPWACQVWGIFEHTEPGPVRDGVPGRSTTGYHLILLAAWDGQVSYPEARRKILQTYHDWTIDDCPPDEVVIEDKAMGPHLIREFQASGMDGIVPYDPKDGNKAARADRVSDILWSGRIWAPGRKMKNGTRHPEVLMPYAETVVEQCSLFPAAAHDDHVDTATQAWKRARDLGFVTLDTDLDERDTREAEIPERRESAYG
jgi:predicted phage terminase large subunit-like protein